MKTIESVRLEKKLSAPKSVTTKVELNYTKDSTTDCTIPIGTKLNVHFSETNLNRVYFDYNGSLRALSIVNAHKYITGFSKSPSLSTLERWSNDGYCKTPTGDKTEPDGYGMDGCPSWLLVVGMI